MSQYRPSRRTVVTGSAAAVLAAATPVGHAVASPGPGGPGRGDGRHRAWARKTLREMTLEQKVGQLFVQHVYGSDATTPDQRNVPLYGVAAPADVIRRYHLGGVCYFAWTDSVRDPEQILGLSNGLQRAALGADRHGRGGPGRGKGARVPLTISVDQEQGVVTRIGPPATQLPGSMALGAGRSATDARTAAAITGRELRAMGITTDFAPVCDVNVNPLNPVIGTRSFSSRPELAAEMVRAQVRGYQRDGSVSSSGKHFPGHGDTATDSHVAFPVITHSREEWEELDAPPFVAAIAEGIDMIMTAHLAMPAFDDSGDPATLSRPILTGLLREELGYEGVIITDSLEMEGVRQKYGDAEVAVRALEAGADQLLMSPALQKALPAVVAAVESGRISRRELDAKVTRVLLMKARRGVVDHPYADPTRLSSAVGTPRNLAAADAITDRTTTLVTNDDGVLPMTAAGSSVLVTGWGATTTKTVADELTAAGATTTLSTTGASPTDAQIASAVAAARGKDAVVVLTMKAWDTAVTDKTRGQQKLVAALQASGVPTVVVAVRDPYDIAHLGDVPTYLATYAYNAVAMGALVRVLTGEVEPTGTLPVDIPAADDPGTVLYPFGHGLRY
ncbi:glycoside hydrolase family 3 protein [Janibacter sp. Y6]|uniref:glycoside hydrolase family 3 protein n=1 Tax=Janibacter sp. Y6 TaxID=2913552 RepID=UPI0034A1EFFD